MTCRNWGARRESVCVCVCEREREEEEEEEEEEGGELDVCLGTQ